MNRSDPTTYVMVHSAWLGGWAWYTVASLLEKQGHRVIAPDLPGHGKDKTPPAKVTLESYVKTVTDVLDSQGNPVVLVGHSLGGIVISQAAENRPDKVKSLVYLWAFLLPSGGSFMKATEGVKGSMVLDNLVMAQDQTYVTVKEEVMRDGVLDNLSGLGTGKLREHYDAIIKGGGKFYLSGMSSMARGLTEADLKGKAAELATPKVLLRLSIENDRMFTY